MKKISQIYKICIKNERILSAFINKWTNDINNLPQDFNWTSICNNTCSITCNSKTQLVQYKVLYRTHITIHKLYCMVAWP